MSRAERDTWIERVLGVPLARTQETLQGRFGAAARAVGEFEAAKIDGLPVLLAALDGARAALGGPDAELRLDELEALIGKARRAAELRTINPRGIAYPKLLLRWRDAERNARMALEQFGRVLLSMPEVKEDPRLAQVEKAVAVLPRLMPDLGGRLSDLLDAGINAGSDAGIAKEALGVVARYRQTLAAATQLQDLVAFGGRHGGDLKAVSTLDETLAEIAKNLAAAA